jgi:hypothetical protein
MASTSPRLILLLLHHTQIITAAAVYVGYRVHKRLEAQHQQHAQASSFRGGGSGLRNSHLHHPVPGSPFLHHHSSHGHAPGSPHLHDLAHLGAAHSSSSPFGGASPHGDHALGGGKAYGDELLQDRRLRHRYRKLKQNWLQQGQALFSKIRRGGHNSADRWTRRLEDGACPVRKDRKRKHSTRAHQN